MIYCQNMQNKIVLYLTTTFIFFILGLYGLTRFNSWSKTHQIIWQSPIILRTPVYIQTLPPLEPSVIKVSTPSATPIASPIPKTEKQLILAMKHGEILWKIYGLESTWGKNDGCRNNKRGYGGFGVMSGGKVVCYPTFEQAVNRAEHWLVKMNVDKDLATALCTWNTGIKQPNCMYYQKYLSL